MDSMDVVIQRVPFPKYSQWRSRRGKFTKEMISVFQSLIRWSEMMIFIPIYDTALEFHMFEIANLKMLVLHLRTLLMPLCYVCRDH